jgi:hypothetical protein
MPDDPDELLEALDQAEDAFEGYTGGVPAYEKQLDPETNDVATIQLRKGCRLLDACRTLRDHDGYHTSVIEMSFGAIERTLEHYALATTNDSVGDFQNHRRAYERAVELRVLSRELADRLQTLYSNNRSAAYYRDAVATESQAGAVFTLAVRIHDYVKRFGQSRHECCCES